METTQLNYVASLGTNRAKGKGIISVFSQYVSEYVNNSLLIFFFTYIFTYIYHLQYVLILYAVFAFIYF